LKNTNKTDHILFSYFYVMMFIAEQLTSHKLMTTLKIKQVLKTLIYILMILFHYFIIIQYDMFLRVYMFIIMANDTKVSLLSQDNQTLAFCLKRWLAYFTIIVVDDFLFHLFKFSLYTTRIWNCFLIIYILIITGYAPGLKYILLKILKFINFFRLLV